MTRLSGRVAIVTGAGRGIGQSVAKLLASEGASVVVNDLGVAMDGSGNDTGPAHDTVAEISEAGGKAIANGAAQSRHSSSPAPLAPASRAGLARKRGPFPAHAAGHPGDSRQAIIRIAFWN